MGRFRSLSVDMSRFEATLCSSLSEEQSEALASSGLDTGCTIRAAECIGNSLTANVI
jgi:hypothetical protein